MDISAATTLAAGIGVAQAVYTLVNQAFDGKLSKDKSRA